MHQSKNRHKPFNLVILSYRKQICKLNTENLCSQQNLNEFSGTMQLY